MASRRGAPGAAAPVRVARVLFVLLVAWAATFAFADVWLLAVRFDHYVDHGLWPPLAAAVLFNFALFAWLALMLAGVLGRLRPAVLVVSGLAVVLAFANRLKLRNLGEPLLPWDYLSLPQFSGMSSGYLAFDWVAIGAIAWVALCWSAALLLALHDRPRSRRAWVLAAVAMAIPLYAIYLVDGATRRLGGVLNIAWSQAHNLRSNGQLHHLAMNLAPALITTPAGYGEAAVREACQAPADAPMHGVGAGGAGHPHVILILNEAFTRIDRTLAPAVQFDAELTPFFTSLDPVALSVPTFGGYTANAEFEILTGTPMALLPVGAVPFQQYVNAALPNALPRLFRHAGYRTAALHPFHRGFWRRADAYPRLGFDRFLATEDLGLPPGPPYARDASLIPAIVDQVAASETPLFLFVVTMENHGPWFEPRYVRNDVALTAQPAAWSAQARTALANYAQGVRNGDRFLQALVERFAGRDDVVIAMFGDHQPTIVVPDMQNRNLMEARFGDLADRLPPAFADRAILETEIAFWPGGVAFPAGGQATLIGPALAHRAGVPLDGYWRAVERAALRYPTIQRRFAVSAEGVAVAPDAAPEMRVLRLLQYDALFGQRHAGRVCGFGR